MDIIKKIQLISLLGLYHTDVESVILQKIKTLYKFIHFNEEWSYEDQYRHIDESSPINCILDFVNNRTYIKNITYKNKDYYEEDESSSGDDSSGDDSSFESDSSDDDLNEIPYTSKIRYNINIYEEGGYKNIHDLLKIYSTDEIILIGAKSFYFYNESGINHDTRGETKCEIELPFQNDLGFQRYISLTDIMDSFYRIKSHKFDKWYELYVRCELQDSGNDRYYLIFTFDHGS
jgi:hypothetical protein